MNSTRNAEINGNIGTDYLKIWTIYCVTSTNENDFLIKISLSKIVCKNFKYEIDGMQK